MAEGADISENNGVMSPEWFEQFDFVLIRAYNERGRRDKCLSANWANAAGRTLRGVYGWPIPGHGDNRALGTQLVTTAPDAELGYWADVENSDALGMVSDADVEAYLDGIGDRLKGFYSNIGQCPRTPALDRVHWWLADHGPQDGTRHDPNEQPPRPARPWTIHQYTSAGGLDRNWCADLDWIGAPRMATGQDVVDAAATFLGQPYSTAPGRDDPNSGHKDCSGLVAAAYQIATGDRLGANVSVTIFDLCARHGLEIPYEQAATIPGAVILRPDDPYIGWGPAGHIAISDGDGGTVEATPPRVQRLPLSYNAPWSPRAALLPGINYGQTESPTRSPDDMIYYGTEDGKTVGLAMQGNVIVATFTQPATNPYGIPDDALEYSGGQILIKPVPELIIKKLRLADKHAVG